MKTDIVYSAPAMLRLQRAKYMTDYPDDWQKVSDAITDVVGQIRSSIVDAHGDQIDMSLLCNAYTETDFPLHIRSAGLVGMSALYADSGGLQVITRGHQLTADVKQAVYENQSNADYAFCFDEIPVKNHNQGSRSDTSSKEFITDRLDECAITTAKNINNQIKKLNEIGSNTKVYYIVQGNDIDTMVRWVEAGWPYIEDHSRICGFAMADTCIGNSMLESVDMLIAYAKIDKMTGYQYNRVHFLGVGSLSRIAPIVQFSRIGLIRDEVVVSFDSSTTSLCWVYGKILSPTGDIVDFSTRAEVEKYVLPVFDKWFDTINKRIGADYDTTKALLVDKFKSVAALTCIESRNAEHLFMRAFVPVLCFDQANVFSELLHAPAPPKIAAFAECASIDDTVRVRNAIKSSLSSRRIRRDFVSVDGFFS